MPTMSVLVGTTPVLQLAGLLQRPPAVLIQEIVAAVVATTISVSPVPSFDWVQARPLPSTGSSRVNSPVRSHPVRILKKSLAAGTKLLIKETSSVPPSVAAPETARTSNCD